MACIIPQQQLNAALAEVLVADAPEISLYYINNGGNWEPTNDPSKAQLTFQGTWMPVYDVVSGDLRVEMIDLSTDSAKGNNTVILTLTFAAGAILNDKLINANYTQKDPTSDSTTVDEIWKIPMTVSLTLQNLENSKIPANVQEKLNILNKDYGDIFSVQQIVADMSTLTPYAQLNPDIPTGIDQTSWQFLMTCLGDYLKSQEEKGNVPLASLITQTTSKPASSPPAITPTAAGIAVLANTQQKELSALAIAMMTENRTLPGDALTLVNCFDNYAFTDANATGLFLVRQEPLGTTIGEVFAGTDALADLSFYYDIVGPGGAGEYPDFNKTSDNSIPAMSTVTANSDNNNQIASFSYTKDTENDGKGGGTLSAWSWSGNASVNNSFAVKVTVASNAETICQLVLNGTMIISCGAFYNTALLGNGTAKLSPTTFPWSASFNLKLDSNQGTIDLEVADSDFDESPTTDGPSGLVEFLAALAGVTFEDDFDGIRTDISKDVSSTLKTDISSNLSSINNFVLPGNNVFSYSSLFINPGANLVVSIMYRDQGN
ncbi:hypothetical protein JMN32_25285 [Fulvivirga sp. 29W222]|uniref:Uncharacterized protein n=1 Tax=Fulvivirga marina TaxID=2494733 RepID=A0A937G0N4_9BACT|nr:hypothetical protein [Fulvivirga marina]MBL6449649.1 hypothetical protein [Fulvivirga marina]